MARKKRKTDFTEQIERQRRLEELIERGWTELRTKKARANAERPG